MLLELKEASSAQKVLDILAEAEATGGVNLNLFKAQALQQLGRLDESAHYMVLAIRVDSGSLAGVVRELLAEVIERIDEFETEPAGLYSVEMMENCKKLAKFSYLSLDDRQPGLFLAEISIFAADKDKEKLSAVEKLLNILAGDGRDDDVDFLRCQARLFCEQGKFERAAGLWAQVAEMRKNELPSSNQRSWKWWRAKFYELHCFSKLTQTKKEEVLHTIEVLENTFIDIPPLWSEKFSSLKQQCRSSGADF
jgi:tetratricopeptide (TPR) repeat protein